MNNANNSNNDNNTNNDHHAQTNAINSTTLHSTNQEPTNESPLIKSGIGLDRHFKFEITVWICRVHRGFNLRRGPSPWFTPSSSVCSPSDKYAAALRSVIPYKVLLETLQ